MPEIRETVLRAARSPWYSKLLTLIAIGLIVYGLFHYGIIKKDCGQDEQCIYQAARECSPAKAILSKSGNFYEYYVRGERGDNCRIYIKLVKMAPGSPAGQQALFEGKDMTCDVPKEEVTAEGIDEMKNFINHCHGTLKEAIYEQIITKMYGLIIQNLEDII